MANFKYHWDQFLRHPEWIQFVLDSKAVFRNLFKLFSLLSFLLVIIPSLITSIFWVDFSNSGSSGDKPLFELIITLVIYIGYVAYAHVAIVSIFRFRKWAITILIGYNSFIAVTYLLQKIVSRGSFGLDIFFDGLVFGITLSNILIAVVYYKIFEKSIKTNND
ncbi:hypothetical protein [Leptospira licerasiae]|uniref:hypothetical protein n=1 Tax=Leptospira licerasiae TaxID=447106 RepID=UPI0002488CEA|nr:hypothetical protein [Leptospira licerasiae]EIE01271.1 hypothetical protein LEP1GSC185_3567 [Leptospira licerasiae serovar Varillal str. VAR 010]